MLHKLCATLLFCLIIPATVHATVILDMGIEEMTAAAPVVLIGEVRGIQADYNEAHTKIYTWITVTPIEVLKGSSRVNGPVTVKVIGGQVGDTIADMRGAPRFERRERVLLFLEPRKDGDGYLTIGMFMGKFRLYQDEATGEELAIRPKPEGGVHLAGVDHGGARGTVLKLVDVRRIVAGVGGTP